MTGGILSTSTFVRSALLAFRMDVLSLKSAVGTGVNPYVKYGSGSDSLKNEHHSHKHYHRIDVDCFFLDDYTSV